MNGWSIRGALMLTLLGGAALAAMPAQAAKWVQIGAIEYLDTDSVAHEGEVVTYNLFTVVGDKRPDETTEGIRYRLNCKTREEEAPDFPGESSQIVTKDEPVYRRLCRKK